MLKNKLKNFKVILGYKSAIALAFFIAGAGTMAAFASIPDSSGVVHTCYRNTLLSKTFRVIDSPSQTCNGGETPLDLNQTGPQGPQGETGPAGPAADRFTVYYRDGSVSINEGDTHATLRILCNRSTLNVFDYAVGAGYSTPTFQNKLTNFTVTESYNGSKIGTSVSNTDWGVWVQEFSFDPAPPAVGTLNNIYGFVSCFKAP
jgi:hypothetical protein